MLYLLLKTVHIVVVVMYLGNIATAIFWKEHADRTRDPRLIAHALAGIILSDRLITLPGAILITISGLASAHIGYTPMLRTGWVFWGIVLFSLSGVAFVRYVEPLQSRMLKLMKAGVESDSPDWDAYHRLSRAWAIWGAVALLLTFAALVIMVLKPPLPGL
jgi:uncharacterized membrane protein